jgi:hypothetical protein
MTITVGTIACYGTPDRVELTITVDVIACYGTFDRVNMTTSELVNSTTIGWI